MLEAVRPGRLRLAVFDCDGTLVDSQQSIVAAMRTAFAAHAFAAPEPAMVRRVVGLPLAEAVARLLPGAKNGTCVALAEAYRDAFRGLRLAGKVHEPLFPGVAEGLGALEDRGWVLGVATGKAMRGLVSTLDTHGLRRRFVTLQTPDNAPGKPDPQMLHQAMAETGAEAAATVMVGDTTYDMEMARAAGTRAVGVAWGYHAADELRAAGAHIVIDAFAELPKALEDLLEHE